MRRSSFQVEPSFRIEDVDFRPQQQLNPIHTSGHDMQVTEINQVTSTRDAGRMLGDAQQFQSLVGSCLCHLLQRAEGMPAGQRMRVYV